MSCQFEWRSPHEMAQEGPRGCCISDFGDWVIWLIFKFTLIHSVEFKLNHQQCCVMFIKAAIN